MKLLTFVSLLLVLTSAQAQILEKGKKAVTGAASTVGKVTVNAANGLDRNVIHGGFPGVTVNWTCEAGQDNSKQHLPKNQQVKMTMNRLGDIGFKPDIFKTNNNIGNFFKKIFGKKVSGSAEYKPCVDDFLNEIRVAINQYRISSCGQEVTKNPVCGATTDVIVAKAEGKTKKSPFLKVKAETTPTEVAEKPIVPDAPRDTVTITPPDAPRDTVTITPDAPRDTVTITPPDAPRDTVTITAPEVPRETTPTTPSLVPAIAPTPKNGKFFAMMGGGGEPAGTETIFDNFVERVGEFQQTANWNTNVIFNGGHSKTEALIGTKFSPAVSSKPFTPKTYEELISQYERQINSGEIKNGDQLFLLLNSHGSDKTNVSETHSLATSGSVGSSDARQFSGTVSMDRLKKLVQLAEAKGVKLAIADMSCFSGLSQSLGTSKTCVISGTGPNHYSYGKYDFVFNARFADYLKPGANLEDVYLKARQDATDNGFPMINTSVGNTVQDKLYPMVTKYLYTDQTTGLNNYQMLSPNIEKAFQSGSCWTEDAEVQKILEFTNDIESVIDTSLVGFRSAITEYHEYRKKLFNRLRDIGADNIKNDFSFCDSKVITYIANGCMSYSGKQLLSIDFDRMVNAKLASSDTKASKDAYVAFYNKVKQRRDALLTQYPGLNEYKTVYENIGKDFQTVHSLASKVSLESKKLYTKLYQSNRNENTQPNPCKDFVL